MSDEVNFPKLTRIRKTADYYRDEEGNLWKKMKAGWRKMKRAKP